jgi:Na+-transporting NADH:ubiquinone oxidoreductase subunit A
MAQSTDSGFWDSWTIPLVLLLFILFIIPLLIKSAGSKPAYASGGDFYALKKGHNIKLKGAPAQKIVDANVSTFAVQPPNFRGIAPIPKVVVQIGDHVKAGDPLFFNKRTPDILYTAPVSGEVVEINRGEKRAITSIVVLADKEQQRKELVTIDINKCSREDLVNYLKSSGFWPLIKSRPFNIIANPEVVPRDIFISTFDTAPLAPDLNYVVKGKEALFQAGIDVLTKLTTGDVHLGLNAHDKEAPSKAFTQASNVKKHWFAGKHPAGNVGIQIHHAKPMKTTDVVWTLSVQDVIVLGNMVTKREFNMERIIALTGSGLKEPQYVRSYAGARVADLLKDKVVDDQDYRFISGDVLSGEAKSSDSFLNLQDDQLTLVPEGRYAELFGWLAPMVARPSLSKSLISGFRTNATYDTDTNTHGEKRAFVVTGEYEDLLPVDTHPQHLMKAIMVGDFERMEGLGIHELVEEDIALCEFSCTSKMPLQQILREGLDVMREQG